MTHPQAAANPRRKLALEVFEQAYVLQMDGDLELAIDFYRRSIEICPTAEAYTFLGWTYSFQGKIDEAIKQCKKAIRTDPTLGNPYNDIGAYLLGQDKFDEAIPWFEKAIGAKRYEAYHFAWYNLGRAYAGKEWYKRAGECYRKSMELEPGYPPAAEALARLATLVQ